MLSLVGIFPKCLDLALGSEQSLAGTALIYSTSFSAEKLQLSAFRILYWQAILINCTAQQNWYLYKQMSSLHFKGWQTVKLTKKWRLEIVAVTIWSTGTMALSEWRDVVLLYDGMSWNAWKVAHTKVYFLTRQTFSRGNTFYVPTENSRAIRGRQLKSYSLRHTITMVVIAKIRS